MLFFAIIVKVYHSSLHTNQVITTTLLSRVQIPARQQMVKHLLQCHHDYQRHPVKICCPELEQDFKAAVDHLLPLVAG